MKWAFIRSRQFGIALCRVIGQLHLRIRSLSPIVSILAAAVAATLVQPAVANDAPSVGSRIPDSAATVRPVHVIGREDIERSGMSTIHELLVSRSGYNNFGLYRPQLGATVVMIDGRRISGLNSAFVLQSLPVPAIERIEFMSDGAAALYAGGATGAINIVLRRMVSRVRRPGPAPSDRARGAAKSRMPAPCGAARSGAAV